MKTNQSSCLSVMSHKCPLQYLYLGCFCAVKCAYSVGSCPVQLFSWCKKWDFILWPLFDNCLLHVFVFLSLCVCVFFFSNRWSKMLTPGSLRNLWHSLCVISLQSAQRSPSRSVMEPRSSWPWKTVNGCDLSVLCFVCAAPQWPQKSDVAGLIIDHCVSVFSPGIEIRLIGQENSISVLSWMTI